MAQASVSELIRRMEEELGLPLFLRGRRRLILTSAGTVLLPYAEQAVAAVDEGRNAVAATESISRGTVTFGMMRNWRYYGLSSLVQDFHREYPYVALRIVGQSSIEVARSVAGGDLEAGIVVLPVNDTGLEVTPLIRDEVLYATTDRSVMGQPLTMRRLVDLPFLVYDASYGWNAPTRRQLVERIQMEGLQLAPVIELERVEAVLELVAEGLGGTVVPRTIARSPACPDGVLTVPLAEPLFDTIAFIKRKATVLSPAARELSRRATSSLLASVADPLQRLASTPPPVPGS